MSVDARLRHAQPHEDDTWQDRSSSAYDAVLVGARRRRHRQLGVAGGLVAAAAAVTATVLLAVPNQTQPPSPAPPAPTVSTSAPAGALPSSPLDGSWHSQVLTRAQIARGLSHAGLAAYAQDYADRLPDGTFRIHVRIYRGQVEARFGGRLPSDNEAIQVLGGRAVIQPMSAGFGQTHYRWDITDGRLTLHLTGSSVTLPYNEFPALVHIVATYTLATFTRD